MAFFPDRPIRPVRVFDCTHGFASTKHIQN